MSGERLGAYHFSQYRHSKKLEDIHKTIEYGTRALDLTPQDHPDLPRRHAALGMSYAHRYQRLGDTNDLEKALECKHRALALTPDGHPDLPRHYAALGVSYTDQYRHFGKLADLEKAIEYDYQALELTPDGHPDLSRRHAALGVSYTDRYQRLNEVGDLAKAIEFKSRALALTPSGHPDLPDRHAALGASYADRYRHLSEVSDLEKAIEYRSQALALTPSGHPSLPDRHATLGVSHSDRYQRLGEIYDLEKAIQCDSCALELTPVDHLTLPDRHAALGKALEHNSRALSLTPGDHPALPGRYAALGVSYSDRYRHLGELTNLEKAIEYNDRALTLTPDNHPDLRRRHAAMGVLYADRYKRLGELADLEKAIEYDRQALVLTPDGHSSLPDRHAALGASHGDRYRRLGELVDLEQAIERNHHALMLTPEGHPNLPDRYANLGASHNDRYKRLGELNDLDKAIECDSQALALTSDDHPDFPARYAALGVLYTGRYRHTGEIADVEKAIETKFQALTLTPNGHPDLQRRHAALGISYIDRYRCLGLIADLNDAIEFFTDALTFTPEGHSDLSDRHANLGVSYSDRYRRLSELTDLKKAMEHHSRALSLTPYGHSQLPLRHFNLAISCHQQYQQTHDSSHLNNSLSSFREASQLLNGVPRDVFDNAFRWANLASKHSHLGCIEAFQATIDLLPHFIWLGSTTTQRYRDISSTENLAVRAASAAILSCKYALALEWLEHARCVVWSQSLMLRSPVDILQASHPDLATQLQSISRQLHHANSQSSSSHPVVDAPDHRHRLAREYNDLVAQARKLPGFEGFLLPTKTSELIEAARNGPVVVINCEENHCDALIVMPGSGDITHVPLPNFTGTKAQYTRIEMEKSIRSRQPSERGTKRRPAQEEEIDFEKILASLWYDIVKPVLDFLEYTHKTDEISRKMPHITWCPTGAISFLPLHAAGDYERPQSRVFDYVISSYTPTLTALLSSSSSTLDRDCRVLVIGQEATPGHQQLPGTTKELECVVGCIQDRAGYLQLLGSQATTTAVLDAMEHHDWVHLACHAHQNVHDPTDSGFFLHNGTLNLASINQRSLKNKGLAFLSACQTATGDEQLPDEAIHLASGMLTAGYSSVIATMWSVYDDDAPLVADRVYAQLMKHGRIGNGEAGKALHNALGELRDKVGEKEFSHWVPYIHIGS
ncbi:TPR-like protein, partial [Rhizoctonia solani]